MASRIDFEGLAAQLLARAESLVSEWLPGGTLQGHEYVCADLTGGKGRSLSVNLRTGQWADFAADLKGGDLVSLYAAVRGLSNGDAARELGAAQRPDHLHGSREKQPSASRRNRRGDEWEVLTPVPDGAPAPDFKHFHYERPERTWAYRRGGQLFGYVVRFRTSEGGKEILPHTWCRDRSDASDAARWHWKQWPEPRPLYLAAGDLSDRPVLLVEGEKCADAAHQLVGKHFDVVSWPGGSKAWQKADWSWLAGRNVTLWPDCDAKRVQLTPQEKARGVDPMSKPLLEEAKQPGMSAMIGIGALLAGDQRCEVRLCEVPAPGAVPDGWDVADAIEGGWDETRVLEFLERAKPLAQQRTSSRKAAPAKKDRASAPDRFSVDEWGVWFTPIDQEGSAGKLIFVCSFLIVIALVRDASGASWGYLVEFTDPSGARKTIVIAARLLASDGAELRAVLLDQGVRIPATTPARRLLAVYLQSRNVKEFARCVDRTGWHAPGDFVLASRVLSSAEGDGERKVLQAEGRVDDVIRIRGTFDGWRQVATFARGNSRLLFAISCACAAPLVRLARVDSGGFHFRGASSSGKTTVMRVAASFFGPPDTYMQRWRATDNALESLAYSYCDLLLILDELAQVDPRVAGDSAYLLANETGKARSTRQGTARARATWKLLFLSTGEVSLASHMAAGGKQARAGQEARLVDIPAEVSDGTVFEAIHGEDSHGAFAERLDALTARHHGSPGIEWLQWLVDRALDLPRRLARELDACADEFTPEAAAGQVRRVARRFALVAIGGELAIEAGILPWGAGEAKAAARRCFNDWLTHRPGGVGNAEEAEMLRQVRRWLELNAEGRLAWFHRAIDDRSPTKGLRAGFRKLVGPGGRAVESNADHVGAYGIDGPSEADALDSLTEFYLLPEVFDSEICSGLDPRAVKRLLKERGYLMPDKGRPFDSRVRIPGLGLTRCYRVVPTIFAGDE